MWALLAMGTLMFNQSTLVREEMNISTKFNVKVSISSNIIQCYPMESNQHLERTYRFHP
jgi:hypothetical protein